MYKKVLILIAAVVLVVTILLVKGNNIPNPLNPNPAPKTGQEKDRLIKDGYKHEAEVSIGANGFTPQTITVREHTRIYWKNEKGNTLSFQISPSVGGGLEKKDLQITDEEFGTNGKIDPNDGYAYSFHKAGTFKYYNALNPKENGEVTVVKE